MTSKRQKITRGLKRQKGGKPEEGRNSKEKEVEP